MQIKLILISILNIWLLGLPNNLYCPYFLMDGRTFDGTQSRNFLAVSNFELKTSLQNPGSDIKVVRDQPVDLARPCFCRQTNPSNPRGASEVVFSCTHLIHIFLEPDVCHYNQESGQCLVPEVSSILSSSLINIFPTSFSF